MKILQLQLELMSETLNIYNQQDIYDTVEQLVHEADEELQMESPLGEHHDEL